MMEFNNLELKYKPVFMTQIVNNNFKVIAFLFFCGLGKTLYRV